MQQLKFIHKFLSFAHVRMVTFFCNSVLCWPRNLGRSLSCSQSLCFQEWKPIISSLPTHPRHPHCWSVNRHLHIYYNAGIIQSNYSFCNLQTRINFYCKSHSYNIWPIFKKNVIAAVVLFFSLFPHHLPVEALLRTCSLAYLYTNSVDPYKCTQHRFVLRVFDLSCVYKYDFSTCL